MHTKRNIEPPDPSYNWEIRDLPVGSIGKSVFWLFMLVVITGLICIPIMRKMGANVLTEGPDHYELRRLPESPYPLLQDDATAHVDIANLRKEENRLLTTEGRDSTGRPHIPIDQAIEMEAQRVGK